MRTEAKLVIASISFFFVVSVANAAEWVHYHTQESKKMAKRFYDKTAIVNTKENYTKVLSMGSTDVGSSTSLYEIDCKGSRIQDTQLKVYAKPMTEGDVTFQSNTAMGFKPIGAAAELDQHKGVLFQIICKNKN